MCNNITWHPIQLRWLRHLHIETKWPSFSRQHFPNAFSGINTLRQNGHYFSDNIFKCVFLNENIWILINISLKFVNNGQINNITALVEIMAWCRQGDNPSSEPMMFSLLMHICVIWPQQVNHIRVHTHTRHSKSPLHQQGMGIYFIENWTCYNHTICENLGTDIDTVSFYTIKGGFEIVQVCIRFNATSYNKTKFSNILSKLMNII